MFGIDQFSGPELIALAATLSISLSQNKTTDEIAKLSSFFAAVSDNLAILASTDLPET